MSRLCQLAFICLTASLSSHGIQAALMGSCTGGIRTSTDFRIDLDGSFKDPGNFSACGPTEGSLVHAGPGAAGVGVGAATVGASAGAGAISSVDNKFASASAVSTVELEFTLATVIPGTAFGFVPISYEAILTTIDSLASESGSAFASAGAKGFVRVFRLLDNGSGVQAGGIPLEHRNGVAAFFTPGSNVILAADSVTVMPDTPYSIEYSVASGVSAATGSSMGVDGSAGAEFSAAISLAALFPSPGFSESDRYEIQLAIASDPSNQLPGAGVFPIIDSPLSLVPVPASIWLLGSGLSALVGVGWLKASRKPGENRG